MLFELLLIILFMSLYIVNQHMYNYIYIYTVGAKSMSPLDIREVKIDVYGRSVTANAKLQVGFSGEVLAVRS